MAATATLPSTRGRRGGGKPGRSGPWGNENARTHGAYSLKRAISSLGSRTIDRRTAVGKALAAWRSDLVADLGGDEEISTQQAALVELCVREKLILDSIDAYLLGLGGGIVDRRRRALRPVVRERAALADSFTRRLAALGLERRAGEGRTLAAYLAERYGYHGKSADEMER